MVSTQRLTLAEYLALPEEKPYLEFVDGEIIQKATPDTWHGTLQLEIGALLKASPLMKGFYVWTETRFVFGDPPAAYLPDVSVVSRANLSQDAAGRPERLPHVAPDIAIEVLSPPDRAGDVVRKLTFYMDNGVKVAVVIDAEKQVATVHRPGETPSFIAPPEQIELAPAIPGLTLDLGVLFSALGDRAD